MKIQLRHPTGWPYALYVCYTEPKAQMVTAESYDHARDRVFGAKCLIKPVYVLHLIQAKGHKAAHELLSEYGNEWLTFEGFAFFRSAQKKQE